MLHAPRSRRVPMKRTTAALSLLVLIITCWLLPSKVPANDHGWLSTYRPGSIESVNPANDQDHALIVPIQFRGRSGGGFRPAPSSPRRITPSFNRAAGSGFGSGRAQARPSIPRSPQPKVGSSRRYIPPASTAKNSTRNSFQLTKFSQGAIQRASKNASLVRLASASNLSVRSAILSSTTLSSQRPAGIKPASPNWKVDGKVIKQLQILKNTREAAKKDIARLKLNRSLASEGQNAEVGTVIAGGDSKKKFVDIERIVAQNGGHPNDWVKKRSASHTTPDNVQFETHWVENIKSGQRIEFKTIFQKAKKNNEP